MQVAKLDTDEIVELLRSSEAELKTNFGVQRLKLFGSVARREHNESSDVDILITFGRPTGYFGLAECESRLAEILGVKVDLVTPGGLKDAVREKVLAECIYVF
ncbi:MAG: nucleotidyltransferase family protein [Planctomycetes bacterium]|nr:nucleotidyltransferase family protein [Planctomycetota bacterium]